MKQKLSALMFAAAAFIAMQSATPAYAIAAVPTDIITIDGGQFVIDEYSGGSYTVHNNSSIWYIYAFAVSNPNAQTDNPATNYMGTSGTGIVWNALSSNLSLNGPNTVPVNVYLSSFVDQSNGLNNRPGLLAGYVLSDFIAPGETTPFLSFTFDSFPASDAGLLVVDSDGQFGQFSSSATPLPTTWLMLLSGLIGLGFFAYRGTKKSAAAIAVA